MSNNLVVYERLMPTVRGFKHDISEAYKNEEINFRYCSIKQLTNEDISWSDAVFLIRPENIMSYRIARACKRRGIFVISFCDDDLLNIPASKSGIPWRKRALRKTIKTSDLFETSSRYICEKYSKYIINGRSFVMDTMINEKDIDLIPKKQSDNNIKIVYAAGNDHKQLFDKYILPILPRLEEKYKDKITLTLVGVHPDIEKCNEYIHTEYKDAMPLEEYRNYMRNAGFDIGLAPLADTDFNRCKYYNKFIEYTLVGVTGIYSDVIPYSYVVKDRENGFLANNTDSAWYDKICEVIDDAELRSCCITNSIKTIKEKNDAELLKKEWKKAIPEMYEQRNTIEKNIPLVLFRLEYNLWRIADLSFLSSLELKQSGINGWLRKVKSHNEEIKKM